MFCSWASVAFQVHSHQTNSIVYPVQGVTQTLSFNFFFLTYVLAVVALLVFIYEPVLKFVARGSQYLTFT
jgi:hypothetical protein